MTIEKGRQATTRLRATLGAVLIAAAGYAGTAGAQVPENIYQEMLKIGQIVDPACTAKLYRPLMPANDYNSTANPLYPGISLTRDVQFGPHPKDLIDIFSATGGPANRPVLIFVPGGGGNKIEQQSRDANAFYDNIGRWAAKNGMVGVLMQRHPGPDWADPARDVSRMVQWLKANVARHQGNPDRMFAWAHSAGNGPLGTYLGRPETHGPNGVGLKGAILMSGGFNIAPLMMPAPGQGGGPPPGQFGGLPGGPPAAGTTCGEGAPQSIAGAIQGPSGATPPPQGAGGPPPGAGGPPSQETLIARSALPGLKASNVKLFLGTAELDPFINGAMSPFYQALHDELCKEGADKCPTMLFARRHNHMSLVFSPDTPDTSVTGPLLEWMRGIP